MLTRRGGAGDGAADVRRESRRGSSGVGSEGTSKCSVMVEEEVGGGELGKHVVQYIADSAATCNMMPDTDGLTNYRECSRPLGLANGGTTSTVDYGELTVAFRSDNGRGARKTARRSTCLTVKLQPHLVSIFGTERPHVCRRQIWGNFQAEGEGDRTFLPDWKPLPPVRVSPRGER